MDRKWRATALVVGTQIGAGVLGLPYAIKGLGPFLGALAIVLGAFLSLATALLVIEALAVSGPRHHYFSLVKERFGEKIGYAAVVLFLLSAMGALTAYTAGIGEVIADVLPVDARYTSIVAWALLSIVVFLGLRTSSRVELVLSSLMVLLFLGVVAYYLPMASFEEAEFVPDIPLSVFVTAVVVSIFAFFSHIVIPDVVRIAGSPADATEALWRAYIVTSSIYIAFALTVVGVLGEETPEIAIIALDELYPWVNLIPILTMATSFIGVGTGAMDMLKEIVGKRVLSWLFVVIPPLLFFLSGSTFFNAILTSSIPMLIIGGLIPPLLVLKHVKRGVKVTRKGREVAFLLLAAYAFLLVYFSLISYMGGSIH